MNIKNSNLLEKAIKKGFVQIFSANFINKILQFGITIVLSRILDKKVYGSFIYAQNILNIFLLLEGVGSVSGVLQYCSTEKDLNNKLSFFKYGLKLGIISNTIIALTILVFTIMFELPVEGSSQILMYLCILPLLTILFNEIQVFLRSDLKNKKFSIISVTNTVLYFLGNIILGYIFSVKGIVLGRYIAYIASIILGLYFIKDYLKGLKKVDYPEINKRKEFFKYSVVTCFTNSISSILYLLDTFLIGLIIQDSSVVAVYKNATLIPFNLNFIPMSIMVFAYPYFAINSDNKEWIKDKYRILKKYLMIINGFISLVCILFAPLIIEVLFGEKYMESVTAFRILSLGYFIAGTFRIPAGNILASIKQVKFNFYNSLFSGLANIILNIILILKLGSTGAAIATVIVFIISSLSANIYINKFLKKF